MRVHGQESDGSPVRARRRIGRGGVIREHNRGDAGLLLRHGHRDGEAWPVFEHWGDQHDVRRGKAGVVNRALRSRHTGEHFVTAALEAEREVGVGTCAPLSQQDSERPARSGPGVGGGLRR